MAIFFFNSKDCAQMRMVSLHNRGVHAGRPGGEVLLGDFTFVPACHFRAYVAIGMFV